MALISCEECEKQISDKAHTCPHCGNPMRDEMEYEEAKDFSAISQNVLSSQPIQIKNGLFNRFGWFFAVNAAIVLSLSVITAGAATALIPFLLLVSCLFPFVSLLFSRWIAKRAHHIVLIDPSRFQNEEEKSLYELVATLSHKARLPKVPEVGIYRSSEVNAFATGATKKSSLVAFSSALLDNMDETAVAAVAAHEIAHIANGDMITMALVQSVVNSVIYLITLPLTFIKWAAFFSDQVSAGAFWFIVFVRFVCTVILLFLGSLVVKSFSRRREFKADQLAASLLAPSAMIHALEQLRHEKPVVLKTQKAFAAFKINSSRSWLDIFSTHPSLERRIQRLQQLSGTSVN
jgi:heat shock protein HtpX